MGEVVETDKQGGLLVGYCAFWLYIAWRWRGVRHVKGETGSCIEKYKAFR